MIESSPGFRAAMDRFQQELVRWNRQINLVSRQDTQARVAALISQCHRAWSALAGAELDKWRFDDSVRYFDLGSGGGLPGYVWHQLLAERFFHMRTWLVEPREKRAWFLERLNQITPQHPFVVWNTRWSETPPTLVTGATNILISLKALHLSDSKVLGGLVRTAGGESGLSGARIVIARFYPPGVGGSEELAEDLGFAAGPIQILGVDLAPLGQRVLPLSPDPVDSASLVLSSYRGLP